MFSPGRVAHFEEQNSRHAAQHETRLAVAGSDTAGFDVYRGKSADKSTSYYVFKDANGNQGVSSLCLQEARPRREVRLSLERFGGHDNAVVSALAQTAFSELLFAGGADREVVAYAPYDFDNPERTEALSREAAQIYVATLEMQGSVNERGLQYVGDVQSILFAATTALRRYAVPVIRSRYLPEKVA